MKLFGREPVAIIGVVAFVLGVIVAALLAAADAISVQGATWLTVAVAVIQAVMIAIQRSQVTPNPAPVPAPEPQPEVEP